MATDEQSGEEKNLPASDMKLHSLRRKGLIPHSKDFVVAVVTVGLLALFYILLPTLFAVASEYMNVIMDRISDPKPVEIVTELAMATVTFANIAGPFLAATVVLILLANAVDSKGIVISTQAITPNFQVLNPINGLKRLFELRALAEVLKSLIKLTLMAAGAYMAGRLTIGAALWAPTCGIGCALASTEVTLVWIAAIGSALLILAGMADLAISRAIFRHEQMMTITEAKREQKEQFGDPIIKGGRRSFNDPGAVSPIVDTSRMVPNFWFDSGSVAVGLYYVGSEMLAPVVVSRLAGSDRRSALSGKAPDAAVFRDAGLAEDLYRSTVEKRYVPQRFYVSIANALASRL